MKTYTARSFTLAPNPHEAMLNQMSYLPDGDVLEYSRSNPHAAAAMMVLIDDLDAQETNRTWHVYTLTRAGEDLPCHIGLSQNVRATFEHQLMKASEPWGPNLDPVSRAIKIAWGDVTATVTHQYLELEDALRIVVDTTADLLAKSAPLADPIMARRPPEPTESRDWTIYGLYADGAGWLSDGTEIPDMETIYIGRTQNPERRLQKHIENSRLSEPRIQIAHAIRELRSQGVGVKLLALYDRLTEDDARIKEVQVIRDLKADGSPLQNRWLAGEYLPVMGAEGSDEYAAGNRQYHKDRYADDPHFRLRLRAQKAVWNIRHRGDDLTPKSTALLKEADALLEDDKYYYATALSIVIGREDSDA